MAIRKRYNPHKVNKRIADVALTDLCVVWCNGNKDVVAFNYKTTKEILIGESTVMAMDRVRFNWLTYCAVFFREKNGKEKIKIAEVPAPYECFHHQLLDSLNEAHLNFVNEFDSIRDLICGVGWVAIPKDEFLSEETLDQLFRARGAFSYLAPWQEKEKA